MVGQQLDFGATEKKARGMSVAALRFSMLDCLAAGNAAWELEQAGCPVLKTQGYYLDELSVYATELKRRGH